MKNSNILTEKGHYSYLRVLEEILKIPTYMFITSYTFIDFEGACSPTCLFHPTWLFDTLEY